MQALTRSFYAKVFLMISASLMALYTFNQVVILSIGNSEVRQIFAERQLKQNLEWSQRHQLSTDDNELKLELLQTMRSALPDEVIVFSRALASEPAHNVDNFPLPDKLGQASIVQAPAGKHFPRVSQAVVDANGKRWDATRLIAPDRIVISLIDQSANERNIDEFF